jgi:predicted dehydrogenase
MVDMMRMFAGQFTNVHSFITNDYWGHDVEDNAYALMKTEGGIVASLHSSATQWRHTFRLEIVLECGLVELTGILSGSKSYGEETISVTKRFDDLSLKTPVVTRYDEDNSWRDEIDEFARAIVLGEAIVTGSAADALETMKLVESIYCADSTWRQRFSLDCNNF